MPAILRILGLVYKRYKYRLILSYISVIGTAGFALAIPQVLGAAVNNVLLSVEKDTEQLYFLALVLLFAGIGRGLFTFGQNYLGESISQKVAYDLRNAYFDKLQHLSFGFHDQQTTGALMSRATADVEGIRMFVNMGAVRFGFVIAMVVGITIAMLLTDVKLMLVSLSFIPFLAWRAVTASIRLRRIWLRVQEFTADMVAVLQESLTGIRVVKAFAAEEHEKRKFRAAAEQVRVEFLRAQMRWAANFSVMNFGFILALGAILWVGGQDVIEGRSVVNGETIYSGLTPGELTAFLFYMGLLTMPVRMMGWLVNNASRAASCGERIFGILDIESPVQEKPDASILQRVIGKVSFEEVSSRYEDGKDVLKEINVHVLPGQTIALLGRPGSGKTTFAHLLLRFYDVSQGRITIDGFDMRDVTLNSLRQNVGIVQQDIFIHAMSVRENIAYGNIEAPLEKVINAAKVAQLHDFIMDLPFQYDSPIGERGVSLSGGQRQRLSIARTILQDPPILILDDATSSVDAHTEHLLQEALQQVIEGRTTFIITHRLSTIRNADSILVFRDGKIVEQGTHDELMSLGGEYQELYEFQLIPQEEAARWEENENMKGKLAP